MWRYGWEIEAHQKMQTMHYEQCPEKKPSENDEYYNK